MNYDTDIEKCSRIEWTGYENWDMLFEVHIIQNKRISKYLKEEVKKKVLNAKEKKIGIAKSKKSGCVELCGIKAEV